jgi:hypothetical protein
MQKLFILLFIPLALWSPLAVSQDQDEVLAVEWVDLLSQADLDAILNPPELTHDGYGWQDQLEQSGEGEDYLKAMQSADVNPDLVNKRILIPGFIVPTAYNDERKVTEFFLVPFFGACIHLPPPPPNQIIYVTYERGVQLDNFYDAHVVNGMLTSESRRKRASDLSLSPGSRRRFSLFLLAQRPFLLTATTSPWELLRLIPVR